MKSSGKKAVTFYTHGSTVVTVAFPNGDEACQWCRLFLRYEEAYRRYSCRITEEWILDPLNERGMKCPFKMEE